MKRELLQAALQAIDAILLDEMKASDPGRYTRIAKLCGRAHEIQQLGAQRVAQVAAANGIIACNVEEGDYAIGDYQAYGNLDMAMPAVLRNPQGDMMDIMKQAIATLEKQNELRERGPKVEPSAAFELTQLMDVRDRLAAAGKDVAKIDQKIENTLNALNELEDDDAVVHPKLARGHQAGEAGRPALPAHHGQVDDGGEERAGVSAEEELDDRVAAVGA